MDFFISRLTFWRIYRSPVVRCKSSFGAARSDTGILSYGRTGGSIWVSGKLVTYPSPKETLSPTSHSRQNVGLGEG